MIQRKTETYLSKFCTRTKRKTNIRDQQYKSREEEVECFSTQKFIFPLTDSFPWRGVHPLILGHGAILPIW